MGKVCLFIAVLFVSTFSVTAQTRARIADNFDMQSGVKIHTPTPAAVKPIALNVEKSKKIENKIVENKAVKTAVAVKLPQTKPAMTIQMQTGSKSLGGRTTGSAEVDNYLTLSSLKYRIDPLLIYAQMSQESGFKQKATSHKGARGYMQLMPGTAARFGVTDIFSPQQNIDAGVKYMRWLLDKFGGDVRLALAGYNAGEGAVMKYGNAIPPYRETQDYVAKITARYSQMRSSGAPRNAPVVVGQANKVQQTAMVKPAAPSLDRNSYAVRLPNGKAQLINR